MDFSVGSLLLHAGIISFLGTAGVISLIPQPQGKHNAATDTDEKRAVEEGERVIQDFYHRYNTTRAVDLVFVLDRSYSVPSTGWATMLNFVRSLLEHFTVDKDNTRVALITFSTTAAVDVNDLRPDNSRENKCTLTRRLQRTMWRKTPAGYTATHAALSLAEKVLLDSRPNAKKGVFVLTDGRSNIGPPPVRAAFDIQALTWNASWLAERYGPQVEMYALGIQDAYMPELKSISSNIPNHTFLIPDFNTFDQLARTLHGNKQEESWIVTDNFNCREVCHEGALCTCGTRTGDYQCVCTQGYEWDGAGCSPCKQGYFKDKMAPVKCQPCPDNSTTQTPGGSSVAECGCKKGYYKPTNSSYCQALICPALPEIDDGRRFLVSGHHSDEVLNTGITCESVTPGNSCHYECRDGYRLTGPPIMKCQETGQWQGKVPQCRIIDCHGLQYDDVRVHYVNSTTTFGSIVELSCDTGLRMFGDEVRVCSKAGTWSGQSTVCLAVHCPQLVPVDFGNITPPICMRNKSPLGSVCTPMCQAGFQLVGPANMTCHENGHWSQNSDQIRCQDIEKPRIRCPTDITVEAEAGKNFSIIHWREHEPIISDNSGQVTYTVSSHEGNNFGVGYHHLIYKAIDKEGNIAECTRRIYVKVIKARVISCPKDRAAEIKSTLRQVQMTWADPVFHDAHGNALPVMCVPKSGTYFMKGSSKVSCFPQSFPHIECTFMVNISEPECANPNPGQEIKHGSLVCGNMNPVYPRVCRVSCEEKYGIRGFSAPHHSNMHEFYCGWDGMWSVTGLWPSCSRRLRSRHATMMEKLKLSYRGDCSDPDTQRSIISSFHETMAAKIQEICNDFKCTVSKVKVTCNPQRKRRSVGDSKTKNDSMIATSRTRELYLEFELSGSIKKPDIDVSEDDQLDLVETLDDVHYSFEDNPFSFFVNNRTLNVTTAESVDIPTFAVNCSAGQVTVVADSIGYCEVCPVGTFSSMIPSESCIPCDLGYYQDQEGQTKCKPCPATTNTTVTAAPSISYCKGLCEEGTISSSGYEPCTRCVKGSYQSKPASTECLSCPPGSSTSAEGAMNITQCKAFCDRGHYNPESGLQPCLPCPKNFYQSDTGAKSCQKCPGLAQTLQHAANSSDLCQEEDFCGNRSGVQRCFNGGQCTNIGDGYRCACVTGFTGVQCESNIDDCSNDSCLNGATCRDFINGFKCHCAEGYTGKRCDVEIDECASNPCQHGGFCQDDISVYHCVCPSGYQGNNCDQEVNLCSPNPCNHGNCSQDMRNISFSCSCSAGYAGDLCEKMIDVCAAMPCQNEAACVAQEGKFLCQCKPGYSGRFCETKVNECKRTPCQNGGTCINRFPGYVCDCSATYIGKNCETYASPEFDLIFSQNALAEYVVMEQMRTLLSVTVSFWMRSFDKMNYGTVMSYVGETNWLGAEEDLYNHILTIKDYGRFQLIVNGERVVTDVSVNDGQWHHLCFTWRNEGGQWSVYVNGSEVESGSNLAAGSVILSGGHLVLGQNQNSLGGWFNEREAFVGELTQFDVYDNALSANQVKELSKSCHSTFGNVVAWPHVIPALKGGLKASSVSYCLDVNECLYPEVYSCPEDRVCADKVGSYSCECRPGYEGANCTHSIDECRSSPCHNSATCQDFPSFDDFVCNCTEKFTGRNCEYEIQSNLCSNEICQNGGKCQNHQHGAMCQCLEGFTGANCETVVMETCSKDSCLNNGLCVPEDEGYRCVCTDEWRGKRCQIRYNPSCDLSPCLNNGTCIASANGRYTCKCPGNDSLSSWGPNCEQLSLCDLYACYNGGTCVMFNATSHICQCLSGYSGRFCGEVITTQALSSVTNETRSASVTSAVPDYTVLVSTEPISDKQQPVTSGVTYQPPINESSTVSQTITSKQTITSTIDQLSTDAIDIKTKTQTNPTTTTQSKPHTEVHIYHVVVKILKEYDEKMVIYPVFKLNFMKQIHFVYQRSLADSQIDMVINNIRKGSVYVDFDLHHTLNLDGVNPGVTAMKTILARALQKGYIGSLPASTDGFIFERKQAETKHQLSKESADMLVFIAIIVGCCVLFILLLAIIVTTVVKSRRTKHSKRSNLNNVTHRVMNQIIDNPVFENNTSDGPAVTRISGPVDDNIYAEIPSPYAVSCQLNMNTNEVRNNAVPDLDLGIRFPSKRGRDINVDRATENQKQLSVSDDNLHPESFSKDNNVDKANKNCSFPDDGDYLTPSGDEQDDVNVFSPDSDSSKKFGIENPCFEDDSSDTYLAPQKSGGLELPEPMSPPAYVNTPMLTFSSFTGEEAPGPRYQVRQCPFVLQNPPIRKVSPNPSRRRPAVPLPTPPPQTPGSAEPKYLELQPSTPLESEPRTSRSNSTEFARISGSHSPRLSMIYRQLPPLPACDVDSPKPSQNSSNKSRQDSELRERMV